MMEYQTIMYIDDSMHTYLPHILAGDLDRVSWNELVVVSRTKYIMLDDG